MTNRGRFWERKGWGSGAETEKKGYLISAVGRKGIRFLFGDLEVRTLIGT